MIKRISRALQKKEIQKGKISSIIMVLCNIEGAGNYNIPFRPVWKEPLDCCRNIGNHFGGFLKTGGIKFNQRSGALNETSKCFLIFALCSITAPIPNLQLPTVSLFQRFIVSFCGTNDVQYSI